MSYWIEYGMNRPNVSRQKPKISCLVKMKGSDKTFEAVFVYCSKKHNWPHWERNGQILDIVISHYIEIDNF